MNCIQVVPERGYVATNTSSARGANSMVALRNRATRTPSADLSRTVSRTDRVASRAHLEALVPHGLALRSAWILIEFDPSCKDQARHSREFGGEQVEIRPILSEHADMRARVLATTMLALWSTSAGATDGPSVAQVSGTSRGSEIVLRAPSLADWSPRMLAEPYRGPRTPSNGYTHLARPTAFRVPVYSSATKPRAVIARTRRGDVFPVRKVADAGTCFDNGTTGDWWEAPGGFICSTSGYEIAERLKPLETPQRPPAVNRPLPFRFGHVIEKGAARFSRRPTLAELQAMDAIAGVRDAAVPGAVIERMWDDFFIAIAAREDVDGVPVYRSVYGEYVAASHVKLLETPPMQGEHLDEARPLPVAFVRGEDPAPLFCGSEMRRCGEAEKHARFRPRGQRSAKEGVFVVGPGGFMVARDRLRVARAIERPPGVLPDVKWIHIDLSRQTLVAYEGDTPVFATLVSSGKPGHDTPTGLFRVQRKYLSKIMRGNDPKEGIYHVEEVPWTTYYYGAYAVHGAYWHNTFGDVRSHGCTNVAPADARWIYLWGEPELAPHFHAQVRESGMQIYFTRDEG